MAEQHTIPVLDFRALDGPARADFVHALGAALETVGFVAITNHGIAPKALEAAYGAAAETFALPRSVKRQYEDPAGGRERGYTSFGVERALGHLQADLKEFWHVGRDLEADHPATVSGEVKPNRFPREVPAFASALRALYAAMERFSHTLLEAIGEAIDVSPTFFRDMVHDGNSVMRVIHYPDVPDAPPGAVRAAQHEDINLITVLPASTQPGLQLLDHNGHWVPVHTPPDVMICDTGDMMQRLTAGRLKSITHRVVNPDGGGDGGRMSMPFFVHPRADYVLQPMEEGYAPPVRTGDFLWERLSAIGVTREVTIPPHAGAPGDGSVSDEPAPFS